MLCGGICTACATIVSTFSLDDDALTLGGQTDRTFASDVSGCTNVSFTRVISKFDGNNPRHKHQLAVLAAVTEVIKESGRILVFWEAF